MQLAFDSDVTLRSRFECKYIISPAAVPALREFIQPFMAPDRYAARWDGNRYGICSLYLDGQGLPLYQQTVGGEKNRFKLRVRTYDDDPDSKVFFEVKRKLNNIVSKQRAALPREEATRLLDRGVNGWMEGLPAEAIDDLNCFALYADLTNARPLVRVKYMREAYESRGGDPVRVTIDTDLMHSVTLNHELGHETGRWVTTPVTGSILELKFTELYPEWISDLVHVLGLKQQPVPKYVLSVDHMLMEGREAALTMAGFFLPPRTA
jgi:hypothetical protein